MGYVFISYTSANQQMADAFRALLNQNNIETWMAPDSIPFGATYTSTINRAIKGADCFALLLSESAQASPWVLKETERAINAKRNILVIMLDDSPLNDDFELMISTIQTVTLRSINQNDEIFQRILSTVKAYTDEGKKNVHCADSNSAVITSTEQTSSIINMDSAAYFHEYATMKGSRLDHFRGRESVHVVIPEGVTVIGDRAFSYSSELLGVSIPSSVVRIEEYAFIECPKLSVITVHPSNPFYYSEGNCCIERDTKRLVFGCSSSLIPDGITVIGKDAFKGCEGITSVVIPDSVTHIEKSAFSGCTRLRQLTMMDGVEDIDEMAFCGCISLTGIRIPASVIHIANHAFYRCEGFAAIQVAPGNAIYHSENNCCIETKTNRLVFGCKNSIIPDGITHIGAGAFGACLGLRKISIPSSVVEIGSEAFCECKSLESVIIADGVERICARAFMYCSSLRALNIPASVREFVDFAFAYCSGIRSISISPENAVYRSEDDCWIRRADNALVLGCMNSIIPDGITEIGDGAFFGCRWLGDLYLPESVTRIGYDAFGESGLESINIPQNVKYIGDGAFSECNELSSVVIPQSVRFIGQFAFFISISGSGGIEIFCEVSKKPGRWHREWASDDADIYWKGEWSYDEDGYPVKNE